MKRVISKKIIALLLAILLLCAAACTPVEQAAPEATPAADQMAKEVVNGTFSASARGFGGLVTVDVTYTDGVLTNVTAIGPGETENIGGNAVEQLPHLILEAGSVDVDGISGATITSTAIKAAAKEAMEIAFGKETEKSAMKDGTYRATTFGRNAQLTVETTIENGKITTIEVIEHEETPSISDAALERIPATVIAYQSLNVDTISGATRTSSALLTAISQCIADAGGDVVALSQAPVEAPVALDPVQLNADVVIIGAGGAGLAGAIAAAENGSSVIILEKFSYMGGGTLLSGAAFNAAVNETNLEIEMQTTSLDTVRAVLETEPRDEYMKKWQGIVNKQLAEYKKAGATYLFDSPEFHMLQTYIGGDYFGNPELIEMMCYNAPTTYKWLDEMGYPWSNVGTASGALWQRSHQTIEYAKGLGFFAAMNSHIEKNKLDIQIIYEVRADKILIDNGIASGVHGVHTMNGTDYTVTANKGVLVATGGFAANVEMREKYNTQWPSLDASVSTTNGPYATGDGIVMATAIGADLVDMDKIQMLAFAEPGLGRTDSGVGEATNLWVNKEGVRFVDESARRDVLSIAVLEQTDKLFYVISNDTNKRTVDDNTNYSGLKLTDLIAQGLLFKADTLEELAQMINVPADKLIESVAKHNEYCKAGHDPDFGRVNYSDLFLLESGPYYACPRTVAVHHTMGGIKVDTTARVISTSGDPIARLYAAGEVTGGYHGGNRLGGNAVMEAITTGRMAGMQLAREAQ